MERINKRSRAMKLEYVVEVQCDRDVQKFEIKDTI